MQKGRPRTLELRSRPAIWRLYQLVQQPGQAYEVKDLEIDKTDANLQRFVYFAHRFVVEMRDFVGKPLFIYRPDLLKKQHGIPVEPVGRRIDLDMRRQLRLLNLGRNGRHDDRRAEAVANIILNDQNRTHAALFGTYDR